MRILYIGRLFSGLESSLVSQSWNPTGAPTIFKLIEALDAGPHELRLILTCKDGNSSWTQEEDQTRQVEGLKTPISILAGARAIPSMFGSLRTPLRELFHLWQIWQEIWRFKPTIIYLGNANIWSGGLLARLTKTPVVFRMMGVYPAMRNALKGSNPVHVFLRWCYSAPYCAAICTQDGSGIEKWLEDALDPNVEKIMMINGVDIVPLVDQTASPLDDIPNNKTVVLFIGHLEHYKGCDTFVDAVLDCLGERPGQVHALLIGTGSRFDDVTQKINAAGQSENFTFIDRLPHNLISEAHRRADIYVSLNRLGNLSNANLEAMKMGQCIIFPKSQPSLGIDVVTETLFSDDTALRIKDADDKEGLVDAILKLHDSPDLRRHVGAQMKAAANTVIPSWDGRISEEVTTLERLATDNSNPQYAYQPEQSLKP